MRYYSATKRNKIVPFAEMWMDPANVIQSEGNQKEKNKYCIFNAYMWNPGNWYRRTYLQAEIEIQA